MRYKLVKRLQGQQAHPLYRLWHDIKYKKKAPIHEAWAEDFMAFADYVGPRPTDCVLLLRNPELGYIPGNAYWADKREQAKSRVRKY